MFIESYYKRDLQYSHERTIAPLRLLFSFLGLSLQAVKHRVRIFSSMLAANTQRCARPAHKGAALGL